MISPDLSGQSKTKGERTINTDTTMLLNMSQSALQTALDELENAKRMLKWSSGKLIEAQEENRKLCNMLLRFVEHPDPAECSELLKRLETPCGFIRCDLTKDAAKMIRSLAASNAYLREENKRLNRASNS